MAICTTCNIEKDISDFAFKNKEKNKYHTRCKKCSSEANRQLYHKSESRKKQIKSNTKKYKEYLSALIKRYKEFVGCQKCNNKYPYYILDFHHLRDKKAQVPVLVNNGCINKVKEEIKKCIVLCANCHREIHHGAEIQGG